MDEPGTPDSNPLDPGLERRMAAEARRHMVEAEREAAVLADKRRTMADVLRAATDRGDHITVSAGTVVFGGVGIYARGDLLTLETAAALVEVNVGVLDWVRVDARSTAGGRPSPAEAASFPARLGLLEVSRESVDVIGVSGAPRMTGRIRAVARDHVVVAAVDGHEWFLPFGAVAFVVRSHL